jgi:hypothetical protein
MVPEPDPTAAGGVQGNQVVEKPVPPKDVPVQQPAVDGPPPAQGAGGNGDGGGSPTAKIAGLSALRGLILYGAVLAFAGLYGYFIVKIFSASGEPPKFDATLVSSAAALAGVLGSAFALEIGTPTDDRSTNEDLGVAMRAAKSGGKKPWLRRFLSLEPGDTESASWPKTIGIWVYAFVAAAVAITYICNQSETPDTIKALAVAFGGYVIALVNTAYGMTKK